MKYLFKGTILALSMIVLFQSCKKAEVNTSANIAQPVDQKIQQWLNEQPDFSVTQKFIFEGKTIDVIQLCQWDKSTYFEESKTQIIPVAFETGNSKIPVFKYLVIKFNDDGEIINGNYFIVFRDNETASLTGSKTITPDLLELNKIPNDFSGTINKYGVNNTRISSQHYRNGAITDKSADWALKISKNQIPDQNYAPLDPGCSYVTIDWYWQTWINGVLVSEEYLFSTTGVSCPGGGGGGGGGGSNQIVECGLTNAQGAELLALTSYDLNMGILSIAGAPTTYGNGIIRAPQPIKWQFLSLHLFGGYTPEYSAYFSGTIYRMNSFDRVWKWESVSFTNSGKSGGEVPPCFAVVVTVSTSPVISGDQRKVDIGINFQSTTTVTCLFGTEVAHYNGNSVATNIWAEGQPVGN